MVTLQGMVFWFRGDWGQLHWDRAWSVQSPCPRSDDMWLELAERMGY